MNFGRQSAARSFKLVGIGLTFMALSTAAVTTMAQPGPDDLRGLATEGGFSGVNAATGAHGAVPKGGIDFARSEVLPVVSREVSAPSETKESLNPTAPAHHRVPIVTDWSTRHVVFSKPRTEKEAARLEHDTRYKMQIYRRNTSASRKLADAKVDSSDLLNRFRNRVRDPSPLPAKADPAHRDWSVGLNGNGTSNPTPSAGASQFPAKFSFDINAAPDCTNDFVVYNTNTNLLVAFNNLYAGTDPNTGEPNGFCTDAEGSPLSAPTVMWAYNVSKFRDGITSTSVTLSLDGTQVAFVESSPTQGSVLHVVKWHAGDGTIASPVQLYPYQDWSGYAEDWATNCGGDAMYGACMWSVPFYRDLIGHTGTEPDFKPNSVRPDDYTTRSIATDTNSAPYYDYFADVIYVGTDTANLHEFGNVFNGGAAVGPGESTLGTFPIYMNTTASPALTGPIEDAASGRIFIGDSNGNLLYIETNFGPTTPGACSGQAGPTYVYPCLAPGNYSSGANGLPDPPVVDSTLGTVMVLAGSDGLDGDPDNAFAAQAFTTVACVCGSGQEPGGAFTYGVFGPVSGGRTGEPIHSGDFDNNYYNTTGTGSVAGYMYVCAIDPNGASGGGNTALRQIAIGTDGILSRVSSSFLEVATDPTDICSPITEVYNSNTLQDLMFFSVQAHSYACAADPLTGTGPWPAAAPAGGCLMSVDVTADSIPVPVLPATPFFPAAFAAFLPEDGGTSGIIVDNISPDAQASSIYFTPLGWPDDPGNACTHVGCAVKATQYGLN